MGCDIHGHIEVKVNGQWEHYSIPHLDRDYRLFAKAAGERNNPDWGIDPIAQPRGLPKDISIITRKSSDGWGTDGHTHSYLNAGELAQLIEWHSQELQKAGKNSFAIYDQWGFLEGNSFGLFTKYPDECPAWIEDLQFVFWFDN